MKKKEYSLHFNRKIREEQSDENSDLESEV